MSRNTTAIYAFLTVVIILISAWATYFFLCHETIGETELGLKKDNFTGRVEMRVYRTGRHECWPILQSFIRFPTTLQIIEFVSTSMNGEEQAVSSDYGPLNSRTSDGLQVIIEVSFTYQLQSWGLQLYYLYKNYTTQYAMHYLREARSTLRDVASLYTAQEFFFNRTMIGVSMHAALQSALEIKFAETPSFDMLNIDLPDEFEAAIEQVQVARQDYQKALEEQKAAIVRAETAIIEARAQANITVLNAEATAEAYLIDMIAQAEALNITLSAQRYQYYALGEELNLTSSELLALLWVMAIMQHDESLLIIGENTPILITEEFTNTTSSI